VRKTTILFIFVSSLGVAQESETQNDSLESYAHKGLFVSLAGGLAFGTIMLKATNAAFGTLEASGNSFQYDFKIGAVVSEDENLILSLDAIRRSISSPTWALDGTAVYSTSRVSASDMMYGIGITKYFMPSNLFIDGTFGLGRFQMTYGRSKVTSHNGIAVQLKSGIEWLASDGWGLGISGGFSYIAADDESDPSNPGYSGKLSTLKFFLGLCTTYN
jgi:hypothetical protein